tara:strand:- start:3543 stop:3812 length:270 start_codon:yes stop_codon:yes gene_type:complete
MHLFTERFATPTVPTLCYIESGNVALTQPIMIIYIEVEMELEKEAKAFMDRKEINKDLDTIKVLTQICNELKKLLAQVHDHMEKMKKRY